MDDWGASMGRWGHVLTREKWDCDGYTDQTPKFIQGTKDGYVEWGFTGVHTGDITEGISADDVGWLLRGLGSFTDKQIAAALRSSGAEEDEVSCFGNAIRDRIRQLKAVAAGPPS
jgi:hypothetical protein